MSKATEKSPEMEEFLEKNFGRSTAINNDVCIPEPIGCGGEAIEFADELSRREYRISGLCQKCQDSVFGGDDE